MLLQYFFIKIQVLIINVVIILFLCYVLCLIMTNIIVYLIITFNSLLALLCQNFCLL